MIENSWNHVQVPNLLEGEISIANVRVSSLVYKVVISKGQKNNIE